MRQLGFLILLHMSLPQGSQKPVSIHLGVTNKFSKQANLQIQDPGEMYRIETVHLCEFDPSEL